MERFNTDSAADRNQLMAYTQAAGAYRRQLPYGRSPGLIPYGETYPDKLVPTGDYQEHLEWAHDRQILPIYHQHASWAPPGFQWDQNGLGYCWAWGITAALMDCRAREGKPNILLSPVTLGWLVNWQNRGNYLESAIRGVRERGVAPMTYTPDMHSLNYREFKSGWEDAALDYRIPDAEIWDTRSIQEMFTILCTGTPLYIAYNWWGHALELCGLRWDSSEQNNLVWLIRNSHREEDVIEMTGSRAVPDEAYGIRASMMED